MRIKRKNYTFILNYREETYIFQTSARHLKKAFKCWYKLLAAEGIRDRHKVISAYKHDLSQCAPAPLTGLKDVWSHFLFVGKYPAELNIIYA